MKVTFDHVSVICVQVFAVHDNEVSYIGERTWLGEITFEDDLKWHANDEIEKIFGRIDTSSYKEDVMKYVRQAAEEYQG